MSGNGFVGRSIGLTVAAGLLLLVAPSEFFAGSNPTYAFLKTETGARAAALAGSFVSVTNDPNGIFYNPASLFTVDGKKGSVGFFKHLLDINGGHIAYSQEIEDVGRFGAGILYLDYGDFTETDESGNEIGSFGAGDLAAIVGFSAQLEENLSWGVNLKFVYSAIAGIHSSAAALDAGILYTIPEQRIALGASIRNLGTQISSYLDTRESMPLELTVGGSIVPKGLPLLLNLNFHFRDEEVGSFGDRFRAFTIGGEFTLSRVVQVRFGFDNALRKDLKLGTTPGLAGFASGLGINVQGFTVDYAITLLGSIGNLHRVSLTTSF